MKESTYLYEIDIAEVKEQPYYLVLFLKIKAAKALLHKLVRDDGMEDDRRIVAVLKAIDFNINLLKELGYSISEISYVIKQEEAKKESEKEAESSTTAECPKGVWKPQKREVILG